MTLTAPAQPVDSSTGAVPAAPGRTRIAPRALNRVVSAVTADALNVPAGKISTDLTDDAGHLSLLVSTPIGVPSLIRIMDEPTALTQSGGSVLDRARLAQEQIRTRVQQLTGSTVTRVIVKVTGVHIRENRRVR
ncbi:hypothetical protein [Curtobacterium sp. SL109]|uniref:hypothetical protein n=1 Tax=Curtobacterium sp. SL109 TaxID=2994662 RepID=UPI002275EDBD|nr:hypothetical protein [Curtobacterium sp. SL109]MCY1693008.1 hypothetical protein [Curtobacterium sp. SL109]